MNTSEQIAFLTDDYKKSLDYINKGIAENNFRIVSLNSNVVLTNLMEIGLIRWRHNDSPADEFKKITTFLPKGSEYLAKVNAVSANNFPLKTHLAIYASDLINIQSSPVNLAVLQEQPLIDGFFGNVLIGAANIAEWPRYRDALPKGKRYDLARRTNDLYAGLLAGTISAEEGVKQGEALWEEREDDTYYGTSMSGYGDGNQLVVDYQLGAILKKIGSTVPTVHAWRW